MTNYMKNQIKNDLFNYEEGKNIFKRTIKVLSGLNADIFKFTNNQFSTSLYDAIMVGIAKQISVYEMNDTKFLLDKIDKLKINQDFKKYVGSAASSKSRVVNRMKIAIEHFGEVK